MSIQAERVLGYARKFADEKYKEGPNNDTVFGKWIGLNHQPDRKSTRLNSSHMSESRMPSSA